MEEKHNLLKIFSDNGETMQWLHDNVINTVRRCPIATCRSLMILIRRSEGKWFFRCRKCRKEVSYRTGTSFSKSRLSISNLILILYFFYHHLNIKQTSSLTSCERHSVSYYYCIYRRTCARMIGGTQTPIGGPVCIVEIDEAVWRRRKYKRGRAKKQIWIFGAQERGGKAFVYPVANRSASELIPLIKKYIRPGTEIHSDQWKAYSSLSENGFTHKTVNHSEHFVDPITGACTNHIEALWTALRKFMPSHGVRINRMQEFIYSFLFFRNRYVDFSIFVLNVMKYSNEEYKALEDEDFGPKEEEEEAGAEMLHEEESSESDNELETDTSSDGAGDGADASEWEADK